MFDKFNRKTNATILKHFSVLTKVILVPLHCSVQMQKSFVQSAGSTFIILFCDCINVTAATHVIAVKAASTNKVIVTASFTAVAPPVCLLSFIGCLIYLTTETFSKYIAIYFLRLNKFCMLSVQMSLVANSCKRQLSQE